MGQHFDPRKVLRQTSNVLLEKFFSRHKRAFKVDWKEMRETEIEPIFRAWQEMKDADRKAVEVVLQDVNTLATTDEGIATLIQDADSWGVDLRAELDKWTSRYDKAMWTYLNHEEVWRLAVDFARADQLEGTRPWVKRSNIPKKIPRTDEDALGELADAISAFYRQVEGRGHRCKVEHQLRGKAQDYYFVHLSDFADTYIKLDERTGGFAKEYEQRAFPVLVVYDRQAGTLEVYAKGGKKKIIVPLQEIFSRVILQEELPPEDGHINPYQLSPLLKRFDFPVDPADGIDHVRLRRLRISVKGNKKRRIQLEANPDAGPHDIYEMVRDYINGKQLPEAVLDVDLVTLCFHLRHDGRGRLG